MTAIDPVELTLELVRIESPTGSEGAAGEQLARYLGGLGYRVTRQLISPGRFNVFAVREPPVVVLSTHFDTVPPMLPVRQDADFVYGRGTTDAKGILAAQVAAAERLASQQERRVGLLFLVGEEQGGDGARAAATLGPKGRYIINGEPTQNRLALGHKGMLRLGVRGRGRAAHSAYPEHGTSAILPVLDVLQRIRAIPLPVDPVLGETTLNIGTISGGVRHNVIPAECHAELTFRTVRESHGLIEAVRAASDPEVEIEILVDSPPVHLVALPGFETTVVRYGTDLPWLGAWGERLLLGPGSIEVAHTDHERVAKQDLRDAVGLYERLVKVLLARNELR